MHTKLALNEAVQVGPWRVARKHLLFVIIFSLAIIAFGIIILLTHVFDQQELEADNDEEEDEEDEEEEDDSTHWFNMEQKFSTGDWIVVTIMLCAGLMGIGALTACFVVRKDAPHRLPQRNASIYSVKFNKGEATNKTAAPSQILSPNQQMPLWSGQVQMPTPQPGGTSSTTSQSPIQITVSNLPHGKIAPPPYSP